MGTLGPKVAKSLRRTHYLKVDNNERKQLSEQPLHDKVISSWYALHDT